MSSPKITLCRLCLDIECQLVYVFEDNDHLDFKLSEVIQDLLSFRVSEEDYVPWMVCLNCLGKLRDFHNFKVKAIKNNKLLDLFTGSGQNGKLLETEAVVCDPHMEESTCGELSSDHDYEDFCLTLESDSDDGDTKCKPPLKTESYDMVIEELDVQSILCEEQLQGSDQPQGEHGPSHNNSATPGSLPNVEPQDPDPHSNQSPPELQPQVVEVELERQAGLRRSCRVGCRAYRGSGDAFRMVDKYRRVPEECREPPDAAGAEAREDVGTPRKGRVLPEGMGATGRGCKGLDLSGLPRRSPRMTGCEYQGDHKRLNPIAVVLNSPSGQPQVDSRPSAVHQQALERRRRETRASSVRLARSAVKRINCRQR